MIRYILPALFLITASSSAFAVESVPCQVSVNGQVVKEMMAYKGRALGPTYIKGVTKDGKPRSFGISAAIYGTGFISMTITDNDRAVSRGSWESNPDLASIRLPFHSGFDARLTYGDMNDQDPMVEVHCSTLK